MDKTESWYQKTNSTSHPFQLYPQQLQYRLPLLETEKN